MRLGVIGATGMVGSTLIKILQERDFSADDFCFYASPRSAGKTLKFRGLEYVVKALDDNIINDGLDMALFVAGGDISVKYAPYLAEKGVIVIDNSSKFRMREDVPLVVPEVNGEIAKSHKGIISNPNCSTIQAVVALAPLHKAFGLRRVVYSTYQAVSGAGQNGWMDLEEGLKGMPHKHFSHPIAGNIIPQIDIFSHCGYTNEELKMMGETKKILGLPNLGVTATCVRVPVFNGHSISINAEFENEVDIKDVIRILKSSAGVYVKDDTENGVYPMPICADGKDETYIGRIRRDNSVENGLNMWVVADNLRKGAATNAVQIAELFL